MDDDSPLKPRIEFFGTVGFNKALVGATLVSVGEGQASIRLPVAEPVQNIVGTLHGGAIATLVDDAGTMAIMSAHRQGKPGVTTDLNVSYFSAAPNGTAVLADARVLKIGRTLAFVEVDLKNEEGKLLAQGRMTKFMGG